MYVSDIEMSRVYTGDFVSINAGQKWTEQECTLQVSIKIFVCHVQVIIY
jgi:hypothetical protein